MRKTKYKCDVLLIQRTPVDHYPPVLNQVKLLLGQKLNVTVLDGGNGGESNKTLEQINLIRPFLKQHSNLTVKRSILSRVANTLKFIKSIRAVRRKLTPKVIIAYDAPAILALRLSGKSKAAHIYHYHDHAELWSWYEWRASIIYWLSLRCLKGGALVNVADEYRAMEMQKHFKVLANKIGIVRNCPCRLDDLPEKRLLRQYLKKAGYDYQTIGIYQGAVSENYHACEIVRSMSLWPENSCMVFLGNVSVELKATLKKNTPKNVDGNRLFFLESVNYDNLFSYTSDADIAFGLIRPITENFRHMAGASNKRYEYMACGIPQVVNSGEGTKETFEDSGVGVCVDANKSEEIGVAVKMLLLDSDRRKKMSRKARELHLSKYHYEKEFAPVLKKILELCACEK